MTMRFSFAAAALAASPFLTQSRIGEDNGSRRPTAIFKRVTSIMSLSESDGSSRKLQADEDPTKLRCFMECIDQRMTADECVEYIETILGGENLPDHEIPNLTIKISPPRTKEQLNDSYWMFGIPTNIYGMVDCNLNGGNIIYPWDWMVGGTGMSIPEVPCAGLDVNACCDKVHMTMLDENIPLVDDSGNCFSCWSHQEPLEPAIGAGGGVVYLEHSFSANDVCEELELSPFDVQSADAQAGMAISAVVADLDALLASDPVECDALEQLHRDLLMASRGNTQAMSRIPGMLCGLECRPDGTFTITEEMEERLLFIRLKLTTEEVKSDENCIIIYTDRQGKVIEPPKIGGSREGLDVDLEDDCDEVAPVSATGGNTPVQSPVAVVCTGSNEVPNDTASECICAEMNVRNPDTGNCELCKSPLVYSDGTCVSNQPICDSSKNEMLNADGTDCVCLEGEYHRDPASGECKRGCGSGMQFEYSSQSCKCQSNKIPHPNGDDMCVDCQTVYSGTQFDWNSQSCKCQSNKVPNPNGDGSCLDCPQGTTFDWNSQSCGCQWGYVLTDNMTCKKCPDWPGAYDPSSKACTCASGYSFNSAGVCIQGGQPAPTPAVQPAPTPVQNPIPAPVTVPTDATPVFAPAPKPAQEPLEGETCACEVPTFMSEFALVTEGDAQLAAKTIYKGIAVGGTVKRTSTGHNIVVSSNFGNTKSYINQEQSSNLNINYNGQGVQRGATLVDAGIDFDKLKCIARSAKTLGNGDQNEYNVFVKTRGGSYNLYDFHNGGQGENNGKTLVIFNTSEDITLTKSSDGRQFGPSVLAPFSKVTLSDSGFIDGWIVAREFVSSTSSDQMHADGYTGQLSCA